MTDPKRCPRCGRETPANAPEGICPSCLVEMNFDATAAVVASGPGTGGGRTQPMPVEEVARHFPELEMLSLLGAGGMGAVYKARQPQLDRLVALKILDRRGGDPGFVERFSREAKTLARLSHPNIVGVHEFGERNGIFFLIMELVDGATLRDLLRAGKVQPEQALAIVPPICEALQFAHEKGVVHRDIKPENILIDKEGRVKVADFGIARLAGVEAGAENLTGEGQVIGTAHYMAPEQVERPASVDHRADIYALGVVFYEMLTGELPLGQFLHPSEKVEIDVRLDEVVLKALAKEPERRYQQASDVRTRLATVMSSGRRAPEPLPLKLGGDWVDYTAATLLLLPIVASLFFDWDPISFLAVVVLVALAFFRLAPRVPWQLQVVAAVFILTGAGAIWGLARDWSWVFAPGPQTRTYHFNLALLALPVGIGLIRLRPWWRIIALTVIGLTWIALIVLAGVMIVQGELTYLRAGNIGFEHSLIALWWVFLPVVALALVLLWWVFAILRRPEVKVLFQRRGFNRPWLEWAILAGIFLPTLVVAGLLRPEDPLLENTSTVPSHQEQGPPDETGLSEMLEAIRLKHNLPALAAAVMVDGEIVANYAVGVRRQGSAEKVTADDKFHIGSITKSMTATVAAMLVEKGVISWTTTIGEMYADTHDNIHPGYLAVTLEQLLAHRGGAPEDVPGDLWARAWRETGTPAEQRLKFAAGVLAREPEGKPGAQHIYSLAGYTIAGVMLEKASGKTWEELMHSMLFEPLEMRSAGFGAPATLNKVDQPWGHTRRFSRTQAVAPGPRADNPLAVTPGGAVHCSVGDLARYAAFHMAGARGEGALLKPQTFQRLHAPVGEEDYALGWMVAKRGWAGGQALMHNGSNTMFYAVLWAAPERDLAIVAATNILAEAPAACDEAVTELILHFLRE